MSEPEKPLRLFVALELPPAARAALPSPGTGWRVMSSEALHATLAFLGWRPAGDVSVVAAAVEGALRPVGELALGRALLLPPRAPRVMAVELSDPSEELVSLQGAVSEALSLAGVYTPERRAYLPHVTIGRARERVRRDAPVPEVEPVAFRPETVVVYRSLLHRSGARYEPLVRLQLPR